MSSEKVTLKKAWGHLRTITRHKFTVMGYCFRAGLIYQGLAHDLSKYAPVEFMAGARYFSGTHSPNVEERLEKGYSASWLHHKGRNRHHIEYWTDYSVNPADGVVPVEMPRRYVAEMLFDRIAACRVYNGAAYTDRDPLNYFLRGRDAKTMHPVSREQLERLLTMLAEEGEKALISYIKREFLR